MFKRRSLRINAYHGYGTTTRLRAMGRALKDKNIKFSGDTRTFRTLWNIFKQFESDEIKNTTIQLKMSNGHSFEETTDSEGYYTFDLHIPEAPVISPILSWLPYTVSYKNISDRSISDNNIFTGNMMIPSSDTEFGIISDIDDTILHTGAASFFKWRLIVNTFFKNFDKRMPLEGTVEFYKKLQLGKKDVPTNPIFYVSNSPWNLYDYLTAFLKRHHFPEGPILLRDFRIPFIDKKPKNKVPHKLSEIKNILNLYPTLNFILIGDSGEKDADIYTKIAIEFPNRIVAIYLHNVNHKRKERRIKKILTSFTNAPTLLTKTYQESEDHARELGFIK